MASSLHCSRRRLFEGTGRLKQSSASRILLFIDRGSDGEKGRPAGAIVAEGKLLEFAIEFLLEIHPSFEAAAGAKLDSPTASMPPNTMVLLVGAYWQFY